MKLIRCDIHNFRSIKDLSINFDKRLKIFIGYNEAGKSNIIRALSLLNKKNNDISEDDIRDSYSDDDYDENAYVQFILEFNKLETEELYKNMLAKIFTKNEHDMKLLYDFCNNNKHLIYHANLKMKNKYYRYWTINTKNYPIFHGKLRKIQDKNQKSLKIENQLFSLGNYKYIIVDEFMELTDDMIEDTDFNNIIELYFDIKKQLAQRNHPEIISWSYNNFQNIPQKINIQAFVANQDSCIALKNIFLLSDIHDIKSELYSANNKKNGLTNLLRRISKLTTDYIHSVWSEQSLIKINLSENGENIEFAIEDEKNVYEFSRRSDGFKRFISFLLSIGAQNKASAIQDVILLIDEPDIGLHPSSSRQLMNELVNIAKNNYVYFTTHSIFMINREDISSHFIVEKENEITKIKEVDSTNIIDEEILYNALGYSAFDVLKKNNIIFEGWRDKRLFTVGLLHFNDDKEIINISNEIGYCYSQGVKDIHRVIVMLDLAKRNYVIVSDADKPALEARTKSHEKGWLTYNDFNKKIITCEDFLTITYNNSCFSEVCKKNEILVDLKEVVQQENIISQYSDVLKNEKKETQKKVLNEYKELLYENVTCDNIDKAYFEFIKNLLQNIDKYTSASFSQVEGIEDAN